MIVELLLNSADGRSSAAFWGAVFNVDPVDLGGGRWRIEPVAGPAVVVSTTTVRQAISRYADVTVVPVPGAAGRLRMLGYEVAADGSQAVDLNGTDATVHLVHMGWDGVSDFYEDDPDDEEKERIRRLLDMAPPDAGTGEVRVIRTSAPSTLGRFLAAWFAVTPTEIPSSGAVRVEVGDMLFRIEPANAPERQWIPLGARDYAAAVQRCGAAGFTVTPSPTHPEKAGHVDLGAVTFLLTKVDR